MIVADTNVVSELMKAAPHARVDRWSRGLRDVDLHTTSITVAEIRYGIERLPRGRRREAYEATAMEVFRSFGDRILPFDHAAATDYASIVASRERAGTPVAVFDGLIAAICRTTGAQLATRNIGDFGGTGVALVNPWDFPA